MNFSLKTRVVGHERTQGAKADYLLEHSPIHNDSGVGAGGAGCRSWGCRM